MSNSQKKKLIKAENPMARQIHPNIYYFELSAGSVHITTDKDLGEQVEAKKLLKWLV
jgi:hypothetical protein